MWNHTARGTSRLPYASPGVSTHFETRSLSDRQWLPPDLSPTLLANQGTSVSSLSRRHTTRKSCITCQGVPGRSCPSRWLFVGWITVCYCKRNNCNNQPLVDLWHERGRLSRKDIQSLPISEIPLHLRSSGHCECARFATDESNPFVLRCLGGIEPARHHGIEVRHGSSLLQICTSFEACLRRHTACPNSSRVSLVC